MGLIPVPDLDTSLVCQKALLPSVRLGWNLGFQRETWLNDGVTAAKSCSASQRDIVTLMKLFSLPLVSFYLEVDPCYNM